MRKYHSTLPPLSYYSISGWGISWICSLLRIPKFHRKLLGIIQYFQANHTVFSHFYHLNNHKNTAMRTLSQLLNICQLDIYK